MRQWNIEPVLMCNKHILAEHRDMHKTRAMQARNADLTRYYEQGLIHPYTWLPRHDHLVIEMGARGLAHHSPVEQVMGHYPITLHLNVAANRADLYHRCEACAKRMAGVGRGKDSLDGVAFLYPYSTGKGPFFCIGFHPDPSDRGYHVWVNQFSADALNSQTIFDSTPYRPSPLHTSMAECVDDVLSFAMAYAERPEEFERDKAHAEQVHARDWHQHGEAMQAELYTLMGADCP